MNKPEKLAIEYIDTIFGKVKDSFNRKDMLLAYKCGYSAAVIQHVINIEEEVEDTNVLIGYLSKAWGEVGYHTCEIGHPIYRNKLYDSLTYKSLKADIEKTAKFPIGTFDDTMTKI